MDDVTRGLLLGGITFCVFVFGLLIDKALRPEAKADRRGIFFSLAISFSIATNILFMVDQHQRDSCESNVIYRGECLPGQDPLSEPGERVDL